MKNKKGFTLIELLAVIVILAIIALIATPIVMNVIENSRKGAAERSADNYIDAVEVAVAAERIDGPVEDGEYEVMSDGNLCKGTVSGTTCTGTKLTVDVSGNKPSAGGKIIIENGQVVDKLTGYESKETTMSVGDYTVSYDSDGKLVATKVGEVSKICTYVSEEGTTPKTVGAKYTCTLGGEPKTFYVLEVGSNTFEGSDLGLDEFALIMDRNFGSTEEKLQGTTVAWNEDDGDEPTKALEFLGSQTTAWNVETSLPTSDQLQMASMVKYDVSNLPWLYGYLPEYNPDGPSYGYWIANNFSDNSAMFVDNRGTVYYQYKNMNSYTGVRPVITISNDQL